MLTERPFAERKDEDRTSQDETIFLFTLTLYSIVTHFDASTRQFLKTLWKKGKLLVTSNCSFSHNVFYSVRVLLFLTPTNMNLAVCGNIISCFNDVMSHVDCVIKCDVYPQKMHSCSKNIHGISFIVLKIYVVYKKQNIAWVILHGYSRC